MSASGRATDFMQAWGEGHNKPHGRHGWGADDCDRCTAEAFGPWEALIYAAEIMGWVATPPAEPAQAEPMVGIFDVIAVQQNYRRHLLSLDPSPEVRAALDEAIPAPSQPVTCEHGQSASHYTTVISGLCPGPVSVPKENSE